MMIQSSGRTYNLVDGEGVSICIQGLNLIRVDVKHCLSILLKRGQIERALSELRGRYRDGLDFKADHLTNESQVLRILNS